MLADRVPVRQSLPPCPACAEVQPAPSCVHRCEACLLNRLTPEQRTALMPLLRQSSYHPGQYVVNQGDDIDALYFVFDGKLKATRVSSQGQLVLLRVLLPGDTFPMGGFVQGGQYQTTVEAIEPCRLGRIGRQELLRVAAEHGDLAIQLLQELSGHITLLSERVDDLSLLDVQGRVAALLLRLSEGFDFPAGDHRATIRLTHSDIADLVNGRRETVTRVLAHFKHCGWVGAVHGRIQVLDPGALRTLLESDEVVQHRGRAGQEA